MKSIRPLYEQFGAEGYYREHADTYANPHTPEIRALLERNFPRFDCSDGVLDFAAGGGEVTRVLLDLGVTGVVGCDPFTFELYEKQIGQPCLRYTFRDVVRNEAQLGQYSLIISSFALHLCPEKDLYALTWGLLQAAPQIAVLTPHKRPELERLPGIRLLWEDFELTEKGKKVRLKVYGY